MKKEDFVKLGLDEDMATKCADASGEELKGFIPKIRFDEVNTAKQKAEADVVERDKQLETLKTSTGDVESLKTQIATLQADNQKKDDEHATQIHQMKVDTAVEAALGGAKAINPKAVRPFLTGLDTAELDEDGSVKGLSEQIAQLAKDKSTQFLFTQAQPPQLRGANPGHSGREPGEQPVSTTEMTYSQMVAYLAENPGASV